MQRVTDVARVDGDARERRWDVSTWGWWALATAIGGTVGEVALRVIEQALLGRGPGPASVLVQVISWTVLGLVLGTPQWLVLRRRIGGMQWWIPATALAGSIAYPLFNLLAGQVLGLGGSLYLLLVMLGLGFVFGAAQSLVLQPRLGGAIWWVLASSFAWPFEHFIAVFLRRALGGARGTVGLPELIGWVIYGAITGLVLVWLLRARRAVA